MAGIYSELLQLEPKPWALNQNWATTKITNTMQKGIWLSESADGHSATLTEF